MGRVKTLEEIKAVVRERTGKRNIFRLAKHEDVESVLAKLTSKDPELWAREWSRVARPYQEQGANQEEAGKFKEARRSLCSGLCLLRDRPLPRATHSGKDGVFL